MSTLQYPGYPGAADNHEEPQQKEIPQDVRILRQLGDYAAKELILNNPLFIKLGKGELKDEARQRLKEQLAFLDPHIFDLLRIGIESSLEAQSDNIAQALQQIAAYTPHRRKDIGFVEPCTLSFLKTLNKLGGKRNHFQIAAAAYAMLRMRQSEKLLLPPPENPSSARKKIAGIRASLRADIEDTGTLPGGEKGKLIDLSEILQRHASMNEEVHSAQVSDMESSLQNYVLARYPFREGIMKGIETMVKAKKKFYEAFSEHHLAQERS